MSSEPTEPTTPTGAPFAALEGAEFAVLTTYRRSGVAVPTTVWFAPGVDAADRLYITTSRTSGKYKRIRNNPQVTLTASDARGQTQGKPVAGQARVLPPQEFAHATAALEAKYGDQFRAILARTPTGDSERAYIEVAPAS